MPLTVAFPIEKQMMRRERCSVTYRLGSAYLAKAIRYQSSIAEANKELSIKHMISLA
jgi:hypothetical protein